VDSAVSGTGFGIGADAAGNIYVTGKAGSHWLVRKSSNGGASWTTVDDYQVCVTVTNSIKPFRTTTTCYDAAATGFAADSNGNLFAVGYSASANGNQWIVRENPGGNTYWRTVDTFQASGNTGSQAFSICAGTAGDVYVAGTAHGSLNGSRWIVRKN
jgi:hypothetical protein